MLSKLHPRFIGAIVPGRYSASNDRLPVALSLRWRNDHAFFNRGRRGVPLPAAHGGRLYCRTPRGARRHPRPHPPGSNGPRDPFPPRPRNGPRAAPPPPPPPPAPETPPTPPPPP